MKLGELMKKLLLTLISFITVFVFAVSIGANFAKPECPSSVPAKQYSEMKKKSQLLASVQNKAAKYIRFSRAEKTLDVKDKYKIKYSLSKRAKKELTWFSNKPAVASVSKKGVVTAKKRGTATITAKTKNKKTAKINIIVRPKIKNINFSEKKYTIPKGGYLYLSVRYVPASSYEKITWTSSNNSIAKVNSKGVVIGKKIGNTIITATSKKTNKKASCKVKVDRSKYIALTFDDGPHRYNTPRLLDALKKYKGHSTFFMVGGSIPGKEDIIRRMQKEGHELGNHSYSHPNLVKLSNKEIAFEIDKTSRLIKNACGSYPSLLRPPYGSYNKQVLKIANMPSILWNVDTLDWKYKDKNYVKNQIVNSAFDGAIILLHDLHSTTVDGSIAAMKKLKKQGYKFVTVSKLYEIKGIKLKSSEIYR